MGCPHTNIGRVDILKDDPERLRCAAVCCEWLLRAGTVRYQAPSPINTQRDAHCSSWRVTMGGRGGGSARFSCAPSIASTPDSARCSPSSALSPLSHCAHRDSNAGIRWCLRFACSHGVEVRVSGSTPVAMKYGSCVVRAISRQNIIGTIFTINSTSR